MKLKLIHKKLFYLLVFLIPLNLAKHFVLPQSYVGGILIDYLIPTVYVTDILIFLNILLWVFGGEFRKWRKNLNLVRILSLFLIAGLFSVITSSSFFPSMYFFARLILYSLFCVYVACTFELEKDFDNIIKIFALNIFLLGILAFFQWMNQGSVFNNYLFFGEQPYSLSTPLISIKNLFGNAVVPAYGTFRHPNAFGGYLSIILLFAFLNFRKNSIYRISLPVGLVGLFCTLSRGAWASFLFGTMFIFLIKRFGKKGVIISLVLTFLLASSTFFTSTFSKYIESNSLRTRSRLQATSFNMIKNNFLYGVGLNNFTAKMGEYEDKFILPRFIQPDHNIFILALAEGGVFFFLLFCGILFYAGFNLLKKSYGPPAYLFVSLLQLVILGSFDHYLFTGVQTQILFWLIVGLSLSAA